MSKKALKLDDQRVIPGRIIRVINKAKPGEMDNDEVVDHTENILNMIWIEDADGGNERAICLTPVMLQCAENLARSNKEDIPKKSVIQDMID